jgi:Protein of unknown function (DUF1592)/Protein of unknown function (DUF1588)/Protein of unknown function (DUF1585)/Protein of unknown function (DUF1595)/Protein of unknown function (DUF1587)
LVNKSTLLGSLVPLAGGALLLTLPACTGNLIGNADGAGPGSGSTSSTGGSGSMSTPTGGSSATTGPITALDCSKHVVDPGPTTMQLLSHQQYLNTVQALAGDVPGLDQALGDDVGASAFGLVAPDVSQVQLEHYQKAADAIAAVIVGNTASLNKIAPCAMGATGSAATDCAKNLVQKFGALAYRAPVTDAADIDNHLKLFAVGAATSYAHGIELLLHGMLQSPRFLYRVEVGTTEKVSDTAVKLSGYEVAARLSYTLWDSPPDDKLNQAIAAGGLTTKEGVSQQLAWMLQDARGAKLLNRFLGAWMHVGAVDNLVKNPETYPQFQSQTFRDSLKGQAAAFFDDLLANQGGKLNALFTSTTAFYNKDLGAYYGATGTDAFQSLQKTDGTVAGILTLPAVLSVQARPNESSPIYRGRFVREDLLCQTLPAPPANVPPPPEVMPGVSTRERSAQHEVDPVCSSCHKLMDPIGFGFENFDTLGRYRTEDGGKPIDASGNLAQTRDIDGPFNGVAELATKLASSSEVKECVTRQWFRYAMSRFEQPVDGCSMKTVLDSFDAAGDDLNSLPQAIVQSDAFLYRRPVTP